jgi:mono/diheme cytochrome c family protein
MGSPAAVSLAGALALLAAAPAMAAGAQPAAGGAASWTGCCGLPPWGAAGPISNPSTRSGGMLFGGYGSLVGGSVTRHNLALKGAIPAPYATMRNPLPPTPDNAKKGQAVYEAQCASCHGATGLGDGPAAKSLVPNPAQLGWLARIPLARRDAYMAWSISEGGAAVGASAMPAFKGKLSDEEMWAVIGYIDARLPKPAPKKAP